VETKKTKRIIFKKKKKKNRQKSLPLSLNAGTQKPKNTNVQLNPVKPFTTLPSFSNLTFIDINTTILSINF